MKKKSLLVAALAGMLFAFPAQAAAANNDDARVRVLHASPDAPAVDVLVNDKVAVEDLSFGKITGYLLSSTRFFKQSN